MSLSRRYRPQQFFEITGQESVKETLRMEVASGKIGHAYLFFGPRGVGKTTTARIFAKALNCEAPKDGEPCNTCARCEDANNGRAIDLIEMDAASHTGVDNVREGIVDHVRFAPTNGKYKVYILDEAHMLSTSAWNAMLKTLEEPPEHGIFILATTEFHKVPVTIVSRCQRFEFTRLAREEIQARIEEIAKEEKVALDEEVVKRIAKHAEGSIRDAETILGQLVALGEKKITDSVAGLLLPVSRLPAAADFLKTAWSRSLQSIMKAVADLDEHGVQIVPFFHDLIEAVRHLLIASDDEAYAKALASGDEGERAVAECVGLFTPAELRDIALQCMERRKDAKQGVDPRFSLELAGAAIALAILPNSPKSTPIPAKVSIPTNVGAGIHSNGPRTESGVETKVDPEPEPEYVEPPKEEVIEEKTEEAPREPAGDFNVTIQDVRSKWQTFLKRVSEEQPSLSFILRTSRPERVENSTIFILVSYAFHRTKLIDNIAVKQKVESILREIFHPSVMLDAVVGNGEASDEGDEAPKPTDTVGAVLNAFGGQVVE